MKPISSSPDKTAIDFNQDDVLVALRIILGAGSLFFITATALFWMGQQSLGHPIATIGAGLLVLAVAFVVGLKLHVWMSALSKNVRRLAFIMGVIPWNIAILFSFGLMDTGTDLQQIQAIDQSSWSESLRLQVQHLVNTELSLESEKALLVRATATSAVALLMGVVLFAFRRHQGLSHSGAVLMAVSVGSFVFLMGRNSAVVSALLEGFTRLGVL